MGRTGAVWILTAVVVLGATVLAQQSKPTFDAASVRRNTSLSAGWSSNENAGAYNFTNAPLQAVIRIAYRVRDDQILNGPGWLQTDRFDIITKAGAGVSSEQLRLMLQALLEDRFKLVVRREQRERPLLVLLPGRSDARLGPGLKSVLECPRGTFVQRDSQAVPAGAFAIGGCGPAGSVASMVSQHMQSTVIDKTGLVGTYETFLFFAPDAPSATAPGVPDLPSFPAAVREQWGLKLESGRGPVDVLVIDSVSRPTEN